MAEFYTDKSTSGSSSFAHVADDEFDNDFAVQMFDMADTMHTARKQETEEENEKWWIVLHPKVAVRPGPTTEGKPVCVLGQGSVVRAERVERVNGSRWIIIAKSDLPMLVKKKKLKEGESPPPQPMPGTCMMIESRTAGKLMMIAPKEFNWEELASVPPRDRGQTARNRVLGAQVEVDDETIERLLKEADAQLATKEYMPKQPSANHRQPQIHFQETLDGLVDLSVHEAAPAKANTPAVTNNPAAAPAPAPAPSAPAPANAKPMGGWINQPTPPNVNMRPTNKFEEIMIPQAIKERAKREQEAYDELRKKEELKAVERQKQFSKQAREKMQADQLGEAGPMEEGDHGKYGAALIPPLLDVDEYGNWLANIRGGTPGKGPAWGTAERF